MADAAQRVPPPRTERWRPARLFRLLVDRAPRLPIPFRFADASDAPLVVRGLRGSDVLNAVDQAMDSSEDARELAFCPMMLELALVTPEGRPFADAATYRQVDADELRRAWGAVSSALNIVAPIRATADMPEWERVLHLGAQQNGSIAGRIAECLDVSVGFGGVVRIPRPDRYFGLPICELTDGQLMAFGAAYRINHS